MLALQRMGDLRGKVMSKGTYSHVIQSTEAAKPAGAKASQGAMRISNYVKNRYIIKNHRNKYHVWFLHHDVSAASTNNCKISLPQAVAFLLLREGKRLVPNARRHTSLFRSPPIGEKPYGFNCMSDANPNFWNLRTRL